MKIKTAKAAILTQSRKPLVVDEITLIGSRCGPFDKAIDLLAARKINVRDLIDAIYPLSEGIAAFDHAQRQGALKVLLGSERA